MTISPVTTLCAIALAAILSTPVARAGYSFEAPPSHPDWQPGVEALQRSDYAMAITHLMQVVTNEPDNADARNALGFAYLATRRYAPATTQLREALRIDPKHLSAHENLGRVYLATGNRTKAREHLVALQRLCGGRCDEERSLEKALAATK